MVVLKFSLEVHDFFNAKGFAMGLPTREELAARFLEGAEKSFDARVAALTADIDNLLAHSVGIDDHQRLDNSLCDLFEKLSAEQDNVETVRQFRAMRGL